MDLVNLLLSGTLVAALYKIATLRPQIRQERAKALRAEAEADDVHIDNTEQATRILVENIVRPLKTELNETRQNLNETRQEIARLRQAIDTALACPHRLGCPVLHSMQRQKTSQADHRYTAPHPAGQHRARDDRHPHPHSATGDGDDDPPCL